MDEYFEGSDKNVYDSPEFQCHKVHKNHVTCREPSHRLQNGSRVGTSAYVTTELFSSISTLKAYVGMENVGEGTWSNVLVS